jgi:desampylase
VNRKLHIAPELLEAVRDAARRAYPDECCGLIEGVVADDGWRVLALHESQNLADDPAREFLVDPEIHFRLLRGLRGSERAIIGCFHSHPKGSPAPSESDRAAARDDNFIWLIAGGTRETFTVEAYLFITAEHGFRPLATAVA